jgi:hypothetical protein
VRPGQSATALRADRATEGAPNPVQFFKKFNFI